MEHINIPIITAMVVPFYIHIFKKLRTKKIIKTKEVTTYTYSS